MKSWFYYLKIVFSGFPLVVNQGNGEVATDVGISDLIDESNSQDKPTLVVWCDIRGNDRHFSCNW